MAKLYFRHGAMGSSKTANALMVRYNYEEKGKMTILLKPRLENRDGQTKIRSRIGLDADCEFIEDFIEREKEIDWSAISALIVDESQFLTPAQVDWLSDVVDFHQIPVLCYGLRTDFTGHLFDGSRRLMEVAYRIEELTTVCWCGKRAHFNARFLDGKIVRTGEQVLLGANESYVSLCRLHYKLGMLSEKD